MDHFLSNLNQEIYRKKQEITNEEDRIANLEAQITEAEKENKLLKENYQNLGVILDMSEVEYGNALKIKDGMENDLKELGEELEEIIETIEKKLQIKGRMEENAKNLNDRFEDVTKHKTERRDEILKQLEMNKPVNQEFLKLTTIYRPVVQQKQASQNAVIHPTKCLEKEFKEPPSRPTRVEIEIEEKDEPLIESDEIGILPEQDDEILILANQQQHQDQEPEPVILPMKSQEQEQIVAVNDMKEMRFLAPAPVQAQVQQQKQQQIMPIIPRQTQTIPAREHEQMQMQMEDDMIKPQSQNSYCGGDFFSSSGGSGSGAGAFNFFSADTDHSIGDENLEGLFSWGASSSAGAGSSDGGGGGFLF